MKPCVQLLLCSVQRLYYVQESHGIVVTDLAFLPNSLKGRTLRGRNEMAMLSVAVDSRCQIHTVAVQSKSDSICVDSRNVV